MFGLFSKKKENDIQKLIKNDGIEHATKRFAEVICEMLITKENAYQFILEEVEAASEGNIAAMKFAADSGISPEEYSGAMQNSCPEIDGDNGPQQFLLNISSQLLSDPDLMVRFRTQIAENVMKKFQLGKFKKIEPKMKFVITPPVEPTPELQSAEGVSNYLSKLSKLTRSDFCAELACVMAAKYNIMSAGSSLNEYTKRQEIVTDLTDKATVICISEFGQSAVYGYAGNDLRPLNELVNKVNDEVAQLDLSPDQHGNLLLRKLSEYLVIDSDNENIELEHLTDEDFEEMAQAMQQLTNNLQESSTTALINRQFELAERLGVAASIAVKMVHLTDENIGGMAQAMQQLADSLQAAATLAQPLRHPELYEGLRDSVEMTKEFGKLLRDYTDEIHSR